MRETDSIRDMLKFFDRWTLEKGKDYFKRSKVTTFDHTDKEISGLVKGTEAQLYESVVRYRNKRIYSSSCSCPVGSNCKHCAALLFAFIDLFENTGETQASFDADDAHPMGVDEFDSSSHETSDSKTLTPDKEKITEIKSLPLDQRLADARKVLSQHELSGVSEAIDDSPNDIRSEIKRKLGKDVLNAFAHMKKVYFQQSQMKAVESAPSKNKIFYLLSDSTWTFDPTINIASASVGRLGTIGAVNPLDFSKLANNPPKFATREDINIAMLWRLCLTMSVTDESRRGYLGAGYFADETNLNPKLLRSVLEHILATERCHYKSLQSPPLKLGPELKGELKWIDHSNGYQKLCVVVPQADGELHCLRWNIPWYIDPENNIIGPVAIELDKELIESALQLRPIHPNEAKYLPILLQDANLANVVPVPNGVQVRRKKQQPNVSIETVKRSYPIMGKRGFISRAGEPLNILIFDKSCSVPDEPVLIEEDDGTAVVEISELPDMAQESQDLRNSGFEQIPPHWVGLPDSKLCFATDDIENWLNLSRWDFKKRGWNLDVSFSKILKERVVEDKNLRFSVSETEPFWFNIEMNIEVGFTQVQLLPILMSAFQRVNTIGGITPESLEVLNKDGKFITTLESGDIISIPFERIRAILLGFQEILLLNKKRISIMDVIELVNDPTLSSANWVNAARIQEFAQQIKTLGKCVAVTPPRECKAELRHYQLEGVGWLQTLAEHKFGGILADDMGLGKTVQVIAHICLQKEKGLLTKPFLVVCPTSVLPNWVSECKKFAPHLKVQVLYGPERKNYFDSLAENDLVITTYPLLVRDRNVLIDTEFHGLALDEAQYVKNRSTKMAEAARSLKAEHKICVSGTPIENHLGELWSQFAIIMPGILGDYANFQKQIKKPIERDQDELMQRTLRSRIRPFLLRRTKSEVELELPEKTEIIKTVRIEGPQRDLYESVRISMNQQIKFVIDTLGPNACRMLFITAMLRLRQVCCDPRLIASAKDMRSSAKLDALMEMLEELTAEGHKILVFSQFTSMLDLIEAEIVKQGYRYVQLRGNTKNRVKPIKEFQEGDAQIFLISLKAGGTGLNLTAADTVIHYDPWWNPAVEQQATDRAHRIGQTKPVFVYRLFAEGTIEHRIQQLKELKREWANCIFDEHGGMNGSMTEEDMLLLLCPIEEL